MVVGINRMYCDRRIGGAEKWCIGDPRDADMLLDKAIRECACFVACRDAYGNYHFKGTAFFVSVESAVHWLTPVYIVTAKHVIDKIRDLGCQTALLRLNTNDGNARWFETKMTDWIAHPDESVNADVVVLPMLRDKFPNVDHLSYSLQSTVTPAIIEEHKIGPGEEIFMTGLFVRHQGQKRNIPIIRTGNIAAMREERVSTQVGMMDAYLVESRSMGGLSGSPVFVYLGIVRPIEDEQGKLVLGHAIGGRGVTYLLGMMHGHWNTKEGEQPDAVQDTEKTNMGIGIVIPVERIVETIKQPKVEELSKRIVLERVLADAPEMDSVDDNPPFTKDDFESALKRASRRIQPLPPDEGKSGT